MKNGKSGCGKYQNCRGMSVFSTEERKGTSVRGVFFLLAHEVMPDRASEKKERVRGKILRESPRMSPGGKVKKFPISERFSPTTNGKELGRT